MRRAFIVLVLLAPLTSACLWVPLAAGAIAVSTSVAPAAPVFVVTFVPPNQVAEAAPLNVTYLVTTPAPMRTPIPTETSVPSPTTAPSPTMIPTRTPTRVVIPTRVPASAPTSAPPATSTPLPMPPAQPAQVAIVLSGRGDDVVSMNKWSGAAIVRITNFGTRYFGVMNYDTAGNRVDLLVNTSGQYQGTVLIDKNAGRPSTARFEVNSDGAWRIEVLPLSSATKLVVPGTIDDKGDDVILLTGAKPDLMTATQSGSRYFGIQGYGARTSLLVNTSGPYRGTVPLDPTTLVLEVNAVGPWQLTITGR